MIKNLALVFAMLVVLVTPLALRSKFTGAPSSGAEQTLVIISPHNESIRYEFSRAFAAAHLAKTGQRVRLDFRTPGGTGEIARYVASEYLAAFEDYWTHHLGRPWSGLVATSFDDARIDPNVVPPDDTPEKQLRRAARRAFLDSNISCKLDLFFGGGAYDFEVQAKAGRLVDCGFVSAHPQIFNAETVPQTLSGEPFWDPKGRWIGNVISSFGICYNVDSLRRLGIATPPAQWADLADPRYLRQIALANPTQSSSVSKSIEMLIQQQMVQTGEALMEAKARKIDETDNVANVRVFSTPEDEQQFVAAGWTRAMQLLMKIAANARYFTDASTKIALDVEAGEAAAGMTIDFYGRFQSEAVRRPDGSSRLQYANVAGGSSVGVDPIGLFRGAPHPELAREFIAFVLSPEGQKLWNWKVGTPGGPERYALRRLPVLPQLYAAEFDGSRSDPGVNPYELARTFTYHEAWTGRLFRPIGFIFRTMCIDPHDELTAAWSALIAAKFPPEASAAFAEVSAVDYAAASGRIRDALAGDKIEEVQLAKELADHFRQQYRRAADLARAGH